MSDFTIHPDVIQGSEEWLRLRRGRPTASRAKDIVTPARGELSKSARGYMVELLADCIETGLPPAFAGNSWTDRGTELEPEAIAAWEAHTGLQAHRVGFCTRKLAPGVVVDFGCSPDALVTDLSGDGGFIAGLEAKCPKPRTHAETLLEGRMPEEHKPQVHSGMVVTGLSSWHFVSYCPGMRLFHQVIYRDEYTERVAAAIAQFCREFADFRATNLSRITIPTP